MKWNLDDLYIGFNDDFNNDILKVENLIEEYINLELIDGSSIVKYVSIMEELTKLVGGLFGYCSLRTSTNVLDREAINKMNSLQNLLNKTTKKDVLFTRFLLSFDNFEEVISELGLEKYKFILIENQNSAKYLLSENEEVMYSKMRMLASDSFSDVHSLLTSNLMINYKGKKETLSYIRNLAYDSSSVVRKDAYKKELKAYTQIEDMVALALSNIKREVNMMCEARGYNNALEKTLISSRMDKSTLDAMISSMNDYLPIFRQYFLKKAEYLGHKNGLPFYDLFAPIGSLDKTYTYDEAREIIINNFNSFSTKLGDFARRAFDSNWIDVEPYKGKVGGAFCSNQQQIKQSRILTNFTGSLSDVSTLAHELGHGYHGDVISDELPLNWQYPMPLAETASILCETIVMNNLMSELTNDEELLSVLEISLQGDSQVIVDIMSRYLFEHEVINNTNNQSLDAKTLNEMMIDAQLKTYGDGLDKKYLHPYMWACKGHYYSAGLNFYNFPYAFGLLFAKGLYAKYLENKEEFIKKYDYMLAQTGKMSVEDVAMCMNIDITNKDFWNSSLEIIKSDIEKFISLVDKLKQTK